jgi:hypothetical protein
VSFFTPHDTTGATKLTLSSVAGTATSSFFISNIVIANTNPSAGADDQIDVAHLAQTVGELAARIARPLVVPADDGGSGRQVTFDYIGKNILLDGSTGTYHIQVANATLLGGNTASFFTVQSSTLTLATNDAIRGQAVLTVAR